MLIQIDLRSEEPLYTQIVNQVIEGIARKQLLPGEQLPSVRSLAADLGINLHTVNKAYQLLKQNHYVLIHRQRGVVVNPEPHPPADEHDINRLRSQLRPLLAEAKCKQMSEADVLSICQEIYQDFHT